MNRAGEHPGRLCLCRLKSEGRDAEMGLLATFGGLMFGYIAGFTAKNG
jgi:hypothetical protein